MLVPWLRSVVFCCLFVFVLCLSCRCWVLLGGSPPVQEPLALDSSGAHDDGRHLRAGVRRLLPSFPSPGPVTRGCVVRRSLKLSLFALVLLGLVGGSAAYFFAQKTVTLTVDGQSTEVCTYAATAGEVLADEGLRPASQDVVLPEPGSAVGDGDTIVLNRARPQALTVAGERSDVYTTALSVDGALDELGYRAENLVLSASRSQRLPLDGMDLSIATSKNITVIADGQQRVVTTTAGTAGDLLAEQGLTLSPPARASLS